jgi:large subunit ribosomal protein L2
MALKQYKPTSPARRGLILVDKSALWKGKPVKALTEGKRKTGGRNNKGHVTSRGIAGGHKQKYRYIDFKRRTWDVAATVERLEYDPNRSAFIALVTYEGGEQAYIIAPQRLAPGDKVIAGKKVDVKPGNAMEIGQMPVGTIVHNVELKPGKGGQIARAAGTYVQVVGRDRGMVIVRLNSGEQRYVRSDCMATVGAVSNPDNANQTLAKAGRTRWLGKRPLTRSTTRTAVVKAGPRAAVIRSPRGASRPRVLAPVTTRQRTSSSSVAVTRRRRVNPWPGPSGKVRSSSFRF